MTLTLLDLYNTAATQEWAMYDNDAASASEFEDSLVLALNKSILSIYTSFPFPFRERTHVILTVPKVQAYDLPAGLIKRNNDGRFLVKYNSVFLEYNENSSETDNPVGTPNSFYIQNNQIVLNPIPQEKGLVTIDYYTLSVGENALGEEIFSLKKEDDVLTVPAYLEELMKEAVITRTMLNTIASESDENYSAYKKQADSAYKLLIKYSKGIERDKSVKI